MLTLMLDPHFTSFDVVKTFVGREKMILMVVEYDSKTLLPLLMATLQFLNPNSDGLTKATQIDGDEDSIFGAVNTLHELLINELNLFCHLHVKPKDFMLPLTWWKIHEAQFPNVYFMSKFCEFLGPKSKLKDIARVLTSFQCCGLGNDNLDKLVMIMKN
jgi:hypothetical protein